MSLADDEQKPAAGTDIDRASIDRAAVSKAALVLRQGGLVAIPTETVYGLAADATSDRAVASIFAAKDRPRFNPLIVHVADPDAARRISVWSDGAARLAAHFWPGPLTLILPRRSDSGLSPLISAGGETVALRAPDHPLARALLHETARPLAAPSANPSGRVSPTTAEHVRSGLGGKVDMILDGGPCPVGVESTVLDITGDRPVLLRPGGLARAAIEGVVGDLEELNRTSDRTEGIRRSPGRLASHYAPRHRLRLNAREVAPDEALLAFGPDPLPGAAVTVNLSRTGDLCEAACNLFSMLHHLDEQQVAGIAAMTIPNTGLGEAISDRLARAAFR